MTNRSQLLRITAMLSICGLLSSAGSGAAEQQQSQSAGQPGPDTSWFAEPSATEERPESGAISDAERLIKIGRGLETDRKRLASLGEELAERMEFFGLLSEGIRDIEDDLEQRRPKLAQAEEANDLVAQETLQRQIGGLETDLDLLMTQSDLAFSSSVTMRQQIRELEKKIAASELEFRTLTGVEPTEPEAPGVAPATTEAPPAAAPALPIVPGIPAGSVAPPPPERKEPAAFFETTAQIEALREAERLESAARRAEQRVVLFVEAKESLERQIEFETRLLAAARDSVANLDRALEKRRSDLAWAEANAADAKEIQRLHASIDRIERLIGENHREIGERSAYIESVHDRLAPADQLELEVTGKAADANRQAEAARARLRWLHSPLHPENLLRWARERGPRVLVALVAIALLLILLRLGVRRAARLLVRRGRGERSEGSNRADTLAFSFRSVMTLVILLGGTLLVLQEAGLEVKTVLGGAAILGVAVAFGAQNLMRDYFTGFLILLEDQYELGDLVTIGNTTGSVESVNMRVTVLRDLEGRVHFIPNGEIKSVTNRTFVWGRAVLEVPVTYKENVDRVMELIVDEARALHEDPEFCESLEGEPAMLGVDRFTEYGVIVKFMQQTAPDKMFPVRRELHRRIKNRFDQEGIEIAPDFGRLLRR